MKTARVPPANSVRRTVCFALFAHGPMTAAQVRQVLPNLTGESISHALKGSAQTGYVTIAGHVYTLMPHVAEFFELEQGGNPVFIGQAAAPRTLVINRPLKAVPWAQHLDKLRDISFIGLAGSGVA